MRLLVLNGPNINMLGIREPDIYGKETYDDLIAFVQRVCGERGVEVEFYQSNHEGCLVDYIQTTAREFDGIVFNPAAYTHTSVAIGDAIKCLTCPIVEVHLSDVSKREPFRQISYVRESCIGTITGMGFDGYRAAVDMIIEHLSKK